MFLNFNSTEYVEQEAKGSRTMAGCLLLYDPMLLSSGVAFGMRGFVSACRRIVLRC